MAANTNPMFTALGKNKLGAVLTTAANDYTGQNIENRELFDGDDANGMFVERIRFKALGTNVATVARIYLNMEGQNQVFGTAPGAPTGTPSASGGTMLTATVYGRVVAINGKGMRSPVGTASAAVSVTGPTGSIAWSWTAVPGAVSYELYVGPSATSQSRKFITATNSYTQTQDFYFGATGDPNTGTMALYGEITLPATTSSATLALPDIDYYMNVALAPGTEIYVGLGTTVAAGWRAIAIGGIY